MKRVQKCKTFIGDASEYNVDMKPQGFSLDMCCGSACGSRWELSASEEQKDIIGSGTASVKIAPSIIC